jgi:hypothetical protein
MTTLLAFLYGLGVAATFIRIGVPVWYLSWSSNRARHMFLVVPFAICWPAVLVVYLSLVATIRVMNRNAAIEEEKEREDGVRDKDEGVPRR